MLTISLKDKGGSNDLKNRTKKGEEERTGVMVAVSDTARH